MIAVRGLALMAITVGCLITAGCGNNDGGRPWYSPATGHGTEATHVIILGGTTDGATTATVHLTYRCPPSPRQGARIDAQLFNQAPTDNYGIPITCDGTEHTIDVPFNGAFPADDHAVFATAAMWLPTNDPTTPPNPTPDTAAEDSKPLHEAANDGGPNTTLELKPIH
ncbi:hypothetical protein ACWDUL_21115 [Nocardia niigatensis]